MNNSPVYCEQCGARLAVGARFCEMCGTAVRSPIDQVETIIGHLPVRLVEAGRGFLGRDKKTDMSLVITATRLLFLHGPDEWWAGVSEVVGEEAEETGRSLREAMDAYDFRQPPWDDLYTTPPDELLAQDKHNEAIPLTDIALAVITFTDSLDKMDISLANGETKHFEIYLQAGRTAGRFLARALGADRVRLTALAE